jgi:hypothetical protein
MGGRWAGGAGPRAPRLFAAELPGTGELLSVDWDGQVKLWQVEAGALGGARRDWERLRGDVDAAKEALRVTVDGEGVAGGGEGQGEGEGEGEGSGSGSGKGDGDGDGDGSGKGDGDGDGEGNEGDGSGKGRGEGAGGSSGQGQRQAADLATLLGNLPDPGGTEQDEDLDKDRPKREPNGGGEELDQEVAEAARELRKKAWEELMAQVRGCNTHTPFMARVVAHGGGRLALSPPQAARAPPPPPSGR